MERDSLVEHGTKAFVLTAKGLRGTEMVEVLVKAISRIKKVVAANDGALIATITRSSKVEIKFPTN